MVKHGIESAVRRPGRGTGRAGERLVGVFFLGVVLFSPLVMGIFDRGAGSLVFGIPPLYAFLLGAWALLIALIAFSTRSATEARRRRGEPAESSRALREGRD